MGPRMVNLSECMDPKRYTLEAVFSRVHTRFCQAKSIAQFSQGVPSHWRRVLIHSWLPLDLSLVVRININDGYPEGHTIHVSLDILNFVLASSSDSQTCVPTPPFSSLFIALWFCLLAYTEGHYKKYFTETSTVLKAWCKYPLYWGDGNFSVFSIRKIFPQKWLVCFYSWTQ